MTARRRRSGGVVGIAAGALLTLASVRAHATESARVDVSADAGAGAGGGGNAGGGGAGAGAGAGADASAGGSAGDREGVRLRVYAPPRCGGHDEIAAQVIALGGQLPTPAGNETRASREIDVTLARDDIGIDVRLVVRDVHDLRGAQDAARATERHVRAPDCRRAVHAASLLVVLALDEPLPDRPPAEEVAFAALSPAVWPAPVADDGGTTGMRLVPAGRLGSGGLLVTGRYGFTFDGAATGGVHAMGVARVVGTTRLGLGLTLMSGRREVVRADQLYETRGWSGRAGGAIAWGAPWNDSVVGFAGELGVAVGEEHGAATARAQGSALLCAIECFARGERRHIARSYASPFASASLVFQVPLKRSTLRPVAALTNSWVPNAPHAPSLDVTWSVGLAWQGW